jgi:hypothetical protein
VIEEIEMITKKGYIIFGLISVFVLLVSCAPFVTSVQADTNQTATNFVCFQGGTKIVEVTTVDGATLEAVYIGTFKRISWVWEEKGVSGEKYLTESDMIACMQDLVR